MRVPINPGGVSWCGENPGIYLRDTPDGPFRTLALWFDVVLSPHGRGRTMLVVAAPEEGRGFPDAPNLLMTDNQSLTRWLLDNFVLNMPTFRGKAGLPAARFLPMESCARGGDLKSDYSVTVSGGGHALSMVWSALGEPFAVEVEAGQSATGTHEMYSCFVEAKEAQILLDGSPLPGRVTDRSLFGRTISTAFLAFSETWVEPAAA